MTDTEEGVHTALLNFRNAVGYLYSLFTIALPHNSYVIEVFHSQWCQVAVLLLCCDEGKQVIQPILKCHCYLRAPSLEMTLLHLVVSASSVRLLGNLERGNSSKSSGSWFSSDRLLWNELWRVSWVFLSHTATAAKQGLSVLPQVKGVMRFDDMAVWEISLPFGE